MAARKKGAAMSDEAHMEAARKHADACAILPWHPLQPDEAMMQAEEESWESVDRRADLQEALMCYLFADGAPEVWQNVALRGLAVIRHGAPSLLVGRQLREVATIRDASSVRAGGGLEELLAVCEGDEGREVLRRILNYFFPGTRREWLLEGAQRVYLLARAYQPHLVTVGRREMSYEDMARVFEGDALLTKRARGKARSRWSARAQRVLVLPIEAAGGTVKLQFGKSAGTCAKYAAAAKGNSHRKGKKKA